MLASGTRMCPALALRQLCTRLRIPATSSRIARASSETGTTVPSCPGCTDTPCTLGEGDEMSWTYSSEDDFDGVQYDTFYAPSSAQLEAEEIRGSCSCGTAWADEPGHDNDQ